MIRFPDSLGQGRPRGARVRADAMAVNISVLGSTGRVWHKRAELMAAIDVHVHVEVDGHGHHSLDDELMEASAKYFRASHDRTPTLEQIADLYRALNMAALVFTVDAST